LLPAALAACASPKPTLTITPADGLKSTVSADSVAQARGLPWKRKITVAVDGGSNAAAPPDEVYYGAPVSDVEHAYKALGLLAPADDLKRALNEFTRFESLTQYNQTLGRAAWSPAAKQLGSALDPLAPGKARDLAPVFAAVHALQEQHFHARRALHRLANEDARAAFAAVIAGDAMLTLLLLDRERDVPRLELSDAVADAMDRLAANLPEFLRRRLSFPYRHGSRFVYWAFKANGWRGVDALYTDRPLATAEILRPEKYFARREPPLRWFPTQLLRRFKESALLDQTLGEDAVAGLLSGPGSEQLAEKIAAGWRSDQLFHFVEGGSPATIWFTAWQTEKQADQFLSAYQTALQRRQRTRFQRARTGLAFEARAKDRGWLLQKNSELVLMVSAAPGSLASLAADAWRDLELDREPMELRFESARARSQP
jgi:hypothetical protein